MAITNNILEKKFIDVGKYLGYKTIKKIRISYI